MPSRRARRARRRGGIGLGAPPRIRIPCAVLLSVSLLCRSLSLPVGMLAELAGGLFGCAALLLPLLLLCPRGASLRHLPLLVCCPIFLSALSRLPPASAWHSGRALRGGGIAGALLARLLSRLLGAPAPYLALPLCLLPYLARLWNALPRSPKRKESAMLFKKKRPTVVDDGGYYPTSDIPEDFSRVRARLEREEAVGIDLADEAARTVYPERRDAAELDIPLDEPTPAPLFSAERTSLTGESDEVSGDVVRADAFFGRPGVSFSENEASVLFPLRAEPVREVSSRAVDAPFATPVVIEPTPAPTVTLATPIAEKPPVAPTAPPTPVAPTTATPTPVAPVAETPEAEEDEEVLTAEELAETAAESFVMPKYDAPATAIFAAGVERVSDAAAQPTVPPVPAPAPEKSLPATPAAPYCFPPLSLLKPSETVGGSTDDEIRRNSESLLETLASFNVQATIRHVSRGPRITRYELIPKRGVRIRNITNLQDDISMNLATAGIRIEAPIPGISAVGVEVPNRKSTAVRLRDLLDHESFRSAASRTTICVGSDVTGEPIYGDIAKMPHALIAGATGMGKSVCINAILLSLLYKASPEEVKLILVDPKKVELNVYNGIPHLLVPVVVEPQKAAGALVWAVGEMERRFNMIEQENVRDIKGYNRIMREHPELGKPLPQIVIVIDELNDLMMSARDAVEDSICRIAQKARAAGIHLLIGTQRPSVDVITGVIKANIPSRVAFHVSSQVDSRTILDMTGAEKLLNNGDMLFYPVGVPKPIRVQGAFVEDDEVEAVTTFLKRGVDASALYDSEVMANIEREAEKCTPKDKRAERGDDEDFGSDGNDLFNDSQFVAAVEIALKLGQISTSKIQSKLRIGFQKATNYIESMEEMGIVGPLNGSKPRDVLITADQFLEMKSNH